jgi:putative ABC transport system permease protein
MGDDMNPWVKACLGIYRRLASAFPQEFRNIYGEELDQMGEDAIPAVWRRYGFRGLAQLMADVALRLPGAYLSELKQDGRYALRNLRKHKNYATVGIASLGIAIGISSMMFAQIHAMVFRPAPGLADPDELVATQTPAPYLHFEAYRDQITTSKSTASYAGPIPFGLTVDAGQARAERVFGHLVSLEYFDTLGVSPQRGRFFEPEIDKPGGAAPAVVSDRFWRTRLGADPEAVGRAIRINGGPATIVGIGPAGFRGVFPGPMSSSR